jgi:hypothetical protein
MRKGIADLEADLALARKGKPTKDGKRVSPEV